MAEHRSTRIWMFDFVRTWCVLSVVVLHAVMSQMTIPWGWPVDDPRKTSLADWIVLLVDLFAMPVLFFVAGFFAWPSLARSGAWGFVRAKFWRLLVPGALVAVLLNPVLGYVFHVTRDFSAGVPRTDYGEYLGRYFGDAMRVMLWRPGTVRTTEFWLYHVWFVSLLFVFMLLTAMWHAVAAHDKTEVTRLPLAPASIRSLLGGLGAASLAAAAGMLCLNWLVPPRTWVGLGPFLSFQCPHVVLYATYYVLGIHAERRAWLVYPANLGRPSGWLLAAGGSFVAYVLMYNHMRADRSLWLAWDFQAAMFALRAIVAGACLMLLLTVGLRHFNGPSARQQHLAARSYTIYLTHLVIVVLLQWDMSRRHAVPALAALTLLVIASLTFSYLAATVLIATLNRLGASPRLSVR